MEKQVGQHRRSDLYGQNHSQTAAEGQDHTENLEKSASFSTNIISILAIFVEMFAET
jgi:hypothetical protein